MLTHRLLLPLPINHIYTKAIRFYLFSGYYGKIEENRLRARALGFHARSSTSVFGKYECRRLYTCVVAKSSRSSRGFIYDIIGDLIPAKEETTPSEKIRKRSGASIFIYLVCCTRLCGRKRPAGGRENRAKIGMANSLSRLVHTHTRPPL